MKTLKPCGTVAAYARHYKLGEKPCGPCRQARSAYMRARRPSTPLKPCGTHAAYVRHLRNGEKPCDECHRSNLRRNAATYAAKSRLRDLHPDEFATLRAKEGSGANAYLRALTALAYKHRTEYMALITERGGVSW